MTKCLFTVLFVLLACVLVAAPAPAQVTLGASASSTNPQRSGDATTGLFSSTAGAVSVSSGGVEILHVNGTGVGIGTSSPAAQLQIYNSSGSTTLGMKRSASNVSNLIGFEPSGVIGPSNPSFSVGMVYTVATGFTITHWDGTNTNIDVYISPSGNVGIGTTGPGSALDVKGTLRLSGSASGFVGLQPAGAAGSTTYTLPTTDGTNGQVLSTNGSGTLSWTTNSTSQWTTSGSNIYFTGGMVGIGTSSPFTSSALDVAGKIRGDFTTVGISFGTICRNGNSLLIVCPSARKYKTNIKSSSIGLKEVLAMKPVTFDYKDAPKDEDVWAAHDFGFIAEDMEKINPLFVTYNDSGIIESVRYMQLAAVNARAIQELNSLLEQQQGELEKQRVEIDELKTTIEQLVHKQ